MPRNPLVRRLLPALFVVLFALPAAPGADSPDSAPNPLELPATDAGLPGSGPIRRYDWFKSLWLKRRTEWAGRAALDHGSIVFLGDSITQGWGDVGSSFPGIHVSNRGISGDTTRGVLIRLDEVLALDPAGVVLLIGTNDLEEHAEPETIAANTRLIVEAFRKHNPAMPFILCQVFPSAAVKSRPAPSIRKTNELVREAVADEPQVTVLDTWSLFADVHGDALADQFPDLLHPNIVGYARWAAALRPVLETVGLIPAWPEDFTPEPGFESLFNGRDLSGWGYDPKAPFEAQAAAPDGRYVVRNGRLIVTAAPVGHGIRKLWTSRDFPRDFVLKLEFRASPNADSGIFIRDPQLQCRDFGIAGPFAALRHYRPLDWNEIVVTVRGNLAHATCNDEVIMDAMPIPATGGIALESDRGQVEYRRIRIHELP